MAGGNQDLVGVTEIAQRYGVAQNSAWRWTRRADFPPPTARLARGPLWARTDVEKWADERLPLRPGPKPRD
jgi:predicted DNA-binding transcriptional regulator AlpA